MDDKPQTFAQAMANKNAALAQQAIALREQNQRLLEALTEIANGANDPVTIARLALLACARPDDGGSRPEPNQRNID